LLSNKVMGEEHLMMLSNHSAMQRLSIQLCGVAGSIIFWMACINHALHHRSNGGLWPHLWWNWSSLLEVFSTCCCILGCVPIFRSGGCICGLLVYPNGMYVSLSKYFYCLLNNCQFSSVDIGLFICRLVEVAAA
jgi:hypothetical protein